MNAKEEKSLDRKAGRVLLNMNDLAALTGIKISTLYRLNARGDLPVTRVGNRCFFLKSRVIQWLESKTRDPLKVAR
jgi:excisionase family DNA binding protein